MSEKRVAAVQLVPNGDNKRLKASSSLNAGADCLPIDDDETAYQKLKTGGFDLVTFLSLHRLPRPYPGNPVLAIPAMTHFCHEGDLGMCRWLFARGANCTQRSGFNRGVTAWTSSDTFPMQEAAYNGHLDLCKWLYEYGGASEDIHGKTTRDGRSLLRVLLEKAQNDRIRETWKWFIMKGALWGEDDDPERFDEIMRREIPVSTFLGTLYRVRPQLLEWAQNMVQIHSNYLRGFLGSVRQSSQDSSPLQVLKGKDDILALIADYAGVPRGRELRTFRLLEDHLPAYIQDTPDY